MNQEALIEEIVQKAAKVVEERIAAPATEQPETKNSLPYKVTVYWWLWKETFTVSSHGFVTKEWISNPVSGEPVLIDVQHTLVLSHVDGSQTIIPAGSARKYRVFR